jgi:uncharacterized protein YndB with AHSA1/START domain
VTFDAEGSDIDKSDDCTDNASSRKVTLRDGELELDDMLVADARRTMKPPINHRPDIYHCDQLTTMSTGTVRLHRILHAPPQKVYRAFTEADAMARWIAPHGFTCTVHSFEAKVGGTYSMSFRNFTTGSSHYFGGSFLELKPFDTVRYTDKFEDPNLPGEMMTTVTIRDAGHGFTAINIVQENLPPMIPVDQCMFGWQESLSYLANLVEPSIADDGRSDASADESTATKRKK